MQDLVTAREVCCQDAVICNKHLSHLLVEWWSTFQHQLAPCPQQLIAVGRPRSLPVHQAHNCSTRYVSVQPGELHDAPAIGYFCYLHGATWRPTVTMKHGSTAMPAPHSARCATVE